MEVVFENTANEALGFFRDLTENELDFVSAGCSPNGPGYQNFECRGMKC